MWRITKPMKQNSEEDKMLTRLIQDFCKNAMRYGAGSVQVLCSAPLDSGETLGIKRGLGDVYARQGLAVEFIGEEKARVESWVEHNEFGEEDEY